MYTCYTNEQGRSQCSTWQPPVYEDSAWAVRRQDEAMRLAAEPTTFIDHPLFAHPDARRQLFGPATRELPQAPATGSWAPILTTEREKLLFLRYNYARKLAAAAQERMASEGPGRSDARDLIRWRRVSVWVRNQIVRANMRLVITVSGKLKWVDGDRGDMVSEGYLALIRAVEHFDASRGLKFSTYAWRAIENAMRRAHGRAARPTLQLDPTLSSDPTVEDRHEHHHDACADELGRIVHTNAAALSPLEHRVVVGRIGMEGRAPMTLQELGEAEGRSEERVRQVFAHALQKIRRTLETTYLDRGTPARAA